MELTNLYLMIFVMIRVGSIFIFAPFFSSSNIPLLVKVSLVASLSFMISGIDLNFADVMNTADIMFYAIHETAIGLIIGLVSSIVFTAVQVAGNLLDFSGGLSMAQTYSPEVGDRASVYGRLFTMVALAVFVVVDGPMLFIKAIIESYRLVPNVDALIRDGILIFVANSVVVCVSVGVQIAIPFVVMFLISDITLGLVSRTIPQINVFILGIPMRFLVGITFIALLAGSLVANVEYVVELVFEAIGDFLNAF